MIKLMVIADDFTGALDAGIKFFSAGASTKVTTDTEMDFGTIQEDVLVLCVPTRHMPPAEAYRVIRRITERAVASGVDRIYKKTDSALRGNIGAELSAVLDGSREKSISFIPALPAMNRITVGGIHYVDGVPVSRSVFGQDPFDPVTESYLPALIQSQCDVATRVISSTEAIPDSEETCIYIMDCASQAEMERRVQMLGECNRLKILAGCAGFAEILPAHLGLTGNSRSECLCSADRLTVICGSVSPISCSQMDYAEKMGFGRIHIPAETLLSEKSLREGADKRVMDQLWSCYLRTGNLVVDSLQMTGGQVMQSTPELTLENIRKKIARRMGQILKELLDLGMSSRIMVIGGDTLQAFLEAIGCRELELVSELQPGVVLSKVTYQNHDYEIVSKSGGFGSADLLVKLGSGMESDLLA